MEYGNSDFNSEDENLYILVLPSKEHSNCKEVSISTSIPLHTQVTIFVFSLNLSIGRMTTLLSLSNKKQDSEA